MIPSQCSRVLPLDDWRESPADYMEMFQLQQQPVSEFEYVLLKCSPETWIEPKFVTSVIRGILENLSGVTMNYPSIRIRFPRDVNLSLPNSESPTTIILPNRTSSTSCFIFNILFNKLTMVYRDVDSYLPRFTSSHRQNVVDPRGAVEWVTNKFWPCDDVYRGK